MVETFNDRDYRTIEKAILFLEENHSDQPTLEDVAREVNLSKFHFHRLFQRWTGTTPKRFLQLLTLNSAKELLVQSQSVMDVALDTGLSGTSRLHDLMVAFEGATPGEFKNGGEGLRIRFGWYSSPFGEMLLALTERGICGLSFVDHPLEKESAWLSLQSKWPSAEFTEDVSATQAVARAIFSLDQQPDPQQKPLKLHLEGTNFQMAVWRALLEIPSGQVATYQDVARMTGQPGAARAVGQAVGNNPVALLIPCHRVIRKTGAFGSYRWGATRKKAILTWEASRFEDRLGGSGDHATP